MGGGRSLSKLGIVLTVIFVVSLLALFMQLFYTLCRRHVFRRQTSNFLSVHSSSGSTFSSKELLYLFRIRQQSRLESKSIPVTSGNDDRNSNRRLDVEVVDIDLLKIKGLFGPPRFLFTIKEEEGEGWESPVDKSLHSGDIEVNKIGDDDRNNMVSLEECFKAADAVVEVEIDCVPGDDATPFSTPSASPLFFTPSASPVHNVVGSMTKEVSRNRFRE